MNLIEYYGDDFSVNGNGFKNIGGGNSKGARGGGKRTKKAAQENKTKVYNSKTARHKAGLMSQVSSGPSATNKKSKNKNKNKKSKGK